MVSVYRKTGEGIIVTVRLIPGASRNEVIGTEKFGENVVLKVKVTAIPEGGKANAALCLLLAKFFKLPKSSFEVISGVKSRTKSVLIRGLNDTKSETLTRLLRQGI